MSDSHYQEPARQLPVRRYDVVVAGAGTGGAVAAIAAARTGARTAVIEAKGYPGGVAVEGGTALHSFFNLWKAFPGVPKRQVVGGIAQEIIDRLARRGGTSGHAEMTEGADYDSVCTAIDTELYKLTVLEMLEEAGVDLLLNTLLVAAPTQAGRIQAAICESRSGREALQAACYVDATGYGDLAAAAGAQFTEPNDHAVANSIALAGVNMEAYHRFLSQAGAVKELARGRRSGKDDQIVRLNGKGVELPEAFREEARKIGMAFVTTSVHDDYFMFIKLNLKMDTSPTDRDAVSKAEVELRKRQYRAVEIFREFVPGCEGAFITRTSPSICIRRGRCIRCDYDIPLSDITGAVHHEDDIMAYGFHDCAPRIQVGGGGTYGIPYRALRPVGLENLLVAGMLITSDWDAHMSTRNTVCCMGQGQAAGTAAALCAKGSHAARGLAYPTLCDALLSAGVILDS